ncbi:M23 family metallopeptidase [Streptomyces sp. DSM 44917]|uniref:M23 family metallopeptidase n=1 Tax=Streptomyces boetiae TaxID=3075541 RepID=A0ABU2LAA6_9ACTN|nr:M23 family metallopeptidase [Streptomyces sp. DSM 44917]MDT0308507.1 M23 family metallopeptidase [Streptomyces sp. DSM 44917]
MSERLLSEVSGHSDYSGIGYYAAQDTLDPLGPGYGSSLPLPEFPNAYAEHVGYPGYPGYPHAEQTPHAYHPGVPTQGYWPGQQEGHAAAHGDGGRQGAFPYGAPAEPGYGHEAAYGTGAGYAPQEATAWQPEAAWEAGADPAWQAGPGQPAADLPWEAEAAHGPGPDPDPADPYGPAADVEPEGAHERFGVQEGVEDAAEVPEPAEAEEEPASAPAPGRRAAARRSRAARRPRRRSAFLSVAAPSLAVLGVTAVAAAATVSDSGTGRGPANEPAPVAAPDPAEVEPVAANERFDTQLAGLTQAADDYADRASRTQGRIDLAEQQEAEARAAAAEAARIEAARPKFFLPVEQHGISAYYGQSGINWMSSHTGIDFPVSYGTSVRAATDGTVTTQWHPSYGNMLIVTAPDGTETWYTHLDSTVYTSGSVQAGTVIAYSGNSGNSTGPHLHFEVRPGGGSPVDPLTWLRSHGLEPT